VHDALGRVFELAQDLIVATLCIIVLAIMAYALRTLANMAFGRVSQPQEILSQVVLLLVLIELFRSLIFYLRQHRVSVALMLEVAIVSELREIVLNPPTAFGTRAYGNALLLVVLGALLLGDRFLAWKVAHRELSS
jgi:uncharacterized membrane protein (DUF373 family)